MMIKKGFEQIQLVKNYNISKNKYPFLIRL